MSRNQKVRTSRMQMYIRELLKEEGLHQSSEEDEEEPDREEESKVQRRRGRQPVPERWTRVMSIHTDDLSNIKTYELASELLLDQNLVGAAQSRGRPAASSVIYWPPYIKK